MTRPLIALGILALVAASARGAGPPERLALADGERIALVGNTFIEREQRYGYLETVLTVRNPDRGLSVRNLGWSGDTVSGIARARFGPVEEGFRHLKQHVEGLRPTVIFVAYGQNEAFEGPAGLPGFAKGLDRLLDVLAGTGARLVLISPIRMEAMGPPLPDPAPYNRDLALYAEVLRKAAAARGARYVELLGGSIGPEWTRLTDDGLHPTATGYWWIARAIAERLGMPSPPRPRWAVELDPSGRVLSARGAIVRDVEAEGRAIRFSLLDPGLEVPPPPGGRLPGATARPAGRDEAGTLRLRGLPPGRYALSIDGRKVEEVRGGEPVVELPGPPYDRARVERLRAAIVEKDELYFHRWRPQNETYLFGFRKHEQGQNAREVPLFDPLVDAKEREIARLRAGLASRYELVREGEEAK